MDGFGGMDGGGKELTIIESGYFSIHFFKILRPGVGDEWSLKRSRFESINVSMRGRQSTLEKGKIEKRTEKTKRWSDRKENGNTSTAVNYSH